MAMNIMLSLRRLPLALGCLLACSCLGNKQIAVDPTSVQLEEIQPGKFPHELMDQVQSKLVDAQGLVDYDALKADPSTLVKYVAYLQKYSPKSHPALFPGENDRKAYYVNAYNGFVLYGVIQNYPGINSVNDVSTGGIKLAQGQGFFYSQRFKMGGEEVNLKSLEDDYVRKFGDPRVHAAINCASLGCPLLPQHAFHPETLDQELDAAIKTYLGEARNFRIDDASKTIYASHIQDWYADDFKGYVAKKTGKADGSVLDYNLMYTDGDAKAAIEKAKAGGYKWVFIEYDWSLNKKGAVRKPVA
jgi:uncharacterized protein DUF547